MTKTLPLPTKACKTVSVAEACLAIGMSRPTAYKLIAAGTFPVPVIKVGTRFRISRAALNRLVNGEAA